MILAGAGVGGGSLNYANTLYRPLGPFYSDRQWAHITDWRAELAPHYDQAKRMLGVTTYPNETAADRAMRAVAERMGVGHTFHSTPVGVHIGRPGETVADPYFGGAGPARKACTECGECMTGCRHGAKNTLNENYLYLAERAGAVIHPMTSVVALTENSRGGFAVRTLPTDNKKKGEGRTFTARRVVIAAGTYGTQTLLHRMRDSGALPRISRRLGELTRTNSESLLGAMAKSPRKYDFTEGVAITSSFHPDEHTHIEPTRVGRGNNALSLLATALTDGGKPYPRFFTWLREVARHPLYFLTLRWVPRWSERSIILLVMQTLDNSITVRGRRTLPGCAIGTRRKRASSTPTTAFTGTTAFTSSTARPSRRTSG
jgi:cholesterol oxidase